MNYEQSIKEARTIEAMKNGYLGLGGKFSHITKKLGSPIIKQGGIYTESNYLEDIEDFFKNDDEISQMDENEATYELGRQFDGLSRGMNLSITVFYHLAEITVTYEGSKVYKEISGELESYCPGFWENHINKLYETTKKIDRLNKIDINKKKKELEKIKKNSILEMLKKKWGI